MKTKQPKAVLISDVHFSLNTLQEASLSMYTAIDKAAELGVPLIVAGDLHDSKANMRAECVNEMLEVFKHAAQHTRAVYIMVGNHDKINEKGEGHSLNFLFEYANIISHPMKLKQLGLYLIPYFSDPDALRAHIKTIPLGSTLIMHQGVKGSDSGEYIIDKSAIDKEDVKHYQVISGHYHQRQTIITNQNRKDGVGTWSYIGNPYTTSFGEAKDPDKGFQILYDDGSLGFVPTKLRKHVIIDVHMTDDLDSGRSSTYEPTDIIWVKARGTSENLKKVDKALVSKILDIVDFRLELIPDEVTTERQLDAVNLPKDQLLDKMIQSLSNTPEEQKERLQTLWKLLLEG